MDKIQNGVSFYQQALNLRALKQQNIASNIANADTPKYLAKEFDFNAALKATQNQNNTQNVVTTNQNHLSLENTSAPQVDLQYRLPAQVKGDGNTVEVEHEKKEMIENSLQFQFLTQLTTDYFNKLRMAMSSERQ
jgi:flagellar basal-body rod protein FlgB